MKTNSAIVENPGLVLGPSEGLSAQLAWLKERYDKASVAEQMRIRRELGPIPRISATSSKPLYRAFLLHGCFDAIGSRLLFELHLRASGLKITSRKLYSHYLPSDSSAFRPFSHKLADGVPSERREMVSLQGEALVAVARSIGNAYERTGFQSYPVTVTSAPLFVGKAREPGADQSRALLESMLRARGGNWAWYAVPLIEHFFYTFDKSLACEVPLYSRELAGVHWVSISPKDSESAILECILDEASWLPDPKSFEEAHNMRQDERFQDLLSYIELWAHRIATGEVSDIVEIRTAIKTKVKRFHGKSWAAPVARITTYVALPVGIAEAIVGSVVGGLGIGSLGFAAQFIDDMLKRSKSKSWLSMKQM